MKAAEHIGLANHFVQSGLLTQEQTHTALQVANQLGLPLVPYLVKNNILTSHVILTSWANAFQLPIFDLTHYKLEWLNHLNIDLIQQYRVIPLHKDLSTLHIGIADPTDRSALNAIAFHTGMKISISLLDENHLDQFILKIIRQKPLEIPFLHESHDDIQPLIKENLVNYDEPIIHFVDNLIRHAVQQHASDIHIEPYELVCRIRYRQDGMLYEIAEIPTHLASRLVTRLKVISKLDIAERRLPQDGRFQYTDPNIDIRINCCPTLFGEKIVLRLADSKQIYLDIHQLGLTPTQSTVFMKALSQPQGLILVTGPTGSGKTVTLYSALHHLNSTEKNISTAEDPIEIQLTGINQVATHPKIGLDFPSLLRTLLRQDPDIIMVGEIRDHETAHMAIQAAQTGHLVLSSIHTNSAIETLSRLHAMGIATYHVINSISLIIAQRLLRKLCESCKQPEILPASTLLDFGLDDPTITLYKATGCEACQQGYLGRIGVFEFLAMTDGLAQALLQGENKVQLTMLAKQTGFIPLRSAGLTLAIAGITSLAEVNRAIRE